MLVPRAVLSRFRSRFVVFAVLAKKVYRKPSLFGAGSWCSLVSTLDCQSRGRGFKSRRARHEMRHKQRATASNRGPLSLQHLSICVRRFAICPQTVTKLADRTIPSLRQSSHGTLHIS